MRSQKELDGERNTIIYEFRKRGCQLKDLEYMFKLSEPIIKGLVEGIEVKAEKNLTEENRKVLVTKIKEDVVSRGYTEEEASYILGEIEFKKSVYTESDINFSWHTEIEKLKAKHRKEIESLEAENARLIKRIEELEAKVQEESAPVIKRRHYTEEEKERMVAVYRKYFRNAKKALEVLHGEGIEVSYRHLLRVLQERVKR